MSSQSSPRAELVDFLATVPLFHNGPRRALEIASEAVQRRLFTPDSVLFQEGDVGEAAYIIRNGTVKLSKVDLGGHEKTLTMLQPPDFFGEMALVGDTTRSASAMAIGQVEVFLLFSDDFLRLMRDYPQISLNVTSTLARRLRGMDDEAQVLSYKDAQGRVAYVLLRLHRGGAMELAEDGEATIRLTHQDLANMAGTSRETVTRALKALEGERVIETRPKEVVITDPEGLEEILHGIR